MPGRPGEGGASPARRSRTSLMQSFKKADHEFMRWRVRLYCGHIMEMEAHYTYADPLSAGSNGRRCSESGGDRQTIVAFEPMGLCGEPPEKAGPLPTPPPPKKPSRADLEQRVKNLAKENERLRAKLTGATRRWQQGPPPALTSSSPARNGNPEVSLIRAKRFESPAADQRNWQHAAVADCFDPTPPHAPSKTSSPRSCRRSRFGAKPPNADVSTRSK